MLTGHSLNFTDVLWPELQDEQRVTDLLQLTSVSRSVHHISASSGCETLWTRVETWSVISGDDVAVNKQAEIIVACSGWRVQAVMMETTRISHHFLTVHTTCSSSGSDSLVLAFESSSARIRYYFSEWCWTLQSANPHLPCHSTSSFFIHSAEKQSNELSPAGLDRCIQCSELLSRKLRFFGGFFSTADRLHCSGRGRGRASPPLHIRATSLCLR